MTQPEPAERIFISHSPADRDFVLRLAGSLRETLGDDAVQFDATDQQANEVWRAQIAQTILASSIVLVILSPDAVSSRWVQEEIKVAQTSGKRIIPVLVRPCTIPPSLADLQSVSFLGQSYGESLVDLLAAIAPDVSRGITLPAVPPAEGDGELVAGPGLPSRAPATPISPPPRSEPEPVEGYGDFPAGQAATPAPPPAYAQPSAPALGAPRGGFLGLGSSSRQTEASARTLQFSAFSPNEIATGTWSTLLVYTYVAEVLAQVQADAATFTELGSAPKETRGASTRKVRQGVELTIEPHMDGVTFSPPSDTFIWRGDWRRSLFRLMADPTLSGTTQAGWIDVYGHGMAPIATIEISFSFHHAIPRAALSVPRGMAVTGNVFDTVFLSYSHRDTEAMNQARQVYEYLGITVLVDELLRAGDNFDERLREMIRSANVFHLLWSRNSAASDYVRKEWTAALTSGKGGRFIRPWYWRKPLVSPPAELAARKISFRYEHLKRQVYKPATWF
ncbi:MAG TPA: toll/interleukin-1 receptor domain-containing protein [Ktedonobacterales bacterium]